MFFFYIYYIFLLRQVDENGKRKLFSGRNRELKEVRHQEHAETLEQLHANGVHAVPISSKPEFHEFIKDNEMTFANFFAPWCMWW